MSPPTPAPRRRTVLTSYRPLVRRMLPALVAFAIGVSIAAGAAALPLTDPVRITFNEVEDRATSGSIMRYCDEQYAVWMQKQSTAGWRLMWSNNYTGDWREPEPVDPGDHPDYEPRVGGIPPDMNVVWRRGVGDNAEIMYAHSDWAGPWTVEAVTSNAIEDLSPDLADNGDGRAHVAWAGWDPQRNVGRVFYGVRELAGGWADEMLEDSVLGPFWTGAAPRISVSYEGIVHVVYRGGDYGDYHCHYARKEAGAWTYQILSSGNLNDFSVDVKVSDDGTVYVAMSGNDGWGMPSRMYVRASVDGGLSFGAPVLVSGSYSADLDALDHGIYGLLVVGAEVSGNIYTENMVLSQDYAEPELLPPANNASQNSSVSEARCISDYPPATSVLFTNRGDELYPPDSTEVYVMSSTVPGGIGDGGAGAAPRSGLRVRAVPNPFSSSTWITVDASEASDTGAARFEAAVYDVSGRLVRRLAGGGGSGGTATTWSAVWDGTGADGRRVQSGSYYLRIDRGERGVTHRLVVVR